MDRDQVEIARNVVHPGDHRTGETLRSPYDKRFVGELKALVPPRERAWLDQAQVWWFQPEHHERIVKLCLQYFGEITIQATKIGEQDEIITRHGRYAQERLL